MATGSMGFAGKIAIDTAGISSSSPGFDFDECSLTMRSSIMDASGLRGTRSVFSERTREGNHEVGGGLSMYPAGEDLAILLPYILGGSGSSPFTLGETLPALNIMVDKVAKVYTYAGCYINRAVFSCSPGQPMKLDLDIIGQTETQGNSGTFQSGVAVTSDAPFAFYDSVLTMLSSSRLIKSFTLTIDNMLAVEFHNSQTATLIMPRSRAITLSFPTPWSSAETDLYKQAVAGAAASLALNNGDKTLTFTFGVLQVPAEGPIVPGRSEIPLQINAVARMTGATKELVTTLA